MNELIMPSANHHSDAIHGVRVMVDVRDISQWLADAMYGVPTPRFCYNPNAH